MGTLTRQDIQSVVDNAKNQILQRSLTRQDIQSQNDILKLMFSNLQQCLQIARQSEYQRVQMMRQIVALEGRLAQMDQELRLLRASTDKIVELQPERVTMPAQPDATQTPEQRYLYSPT